MEENMVLKSSAFDNGGVIPKRHGYKHGNNSLPLEICRVPEDTVSLAVIMDDPDAMSVVGRVWVHWILWNIDPHNTELKEGVIPAGCLQGRTDFGEIGYGGPAPPDKEHTYIFKLYALDKKLDCENGSTKKQIEESMKDHVIAEARLEGRYSP